MQQVSRQPFKSRVLDGGGGFVQQCCLFHLSCLFTTFQTQCEIVTGQHSSAIPFPNSIARLSNSSNRSVRRKSCVSNSARSEVAGGLNDTKAPTCLAFTKSSCRQTFRRIGLLPSNQGQQVVVHLPLAYFVGPQEQISEQNWCVSSSKISVQCAHTPQHSLLLKRYACVIYFPKWQGDDQRMCEYMGAPRDGERDA